MAYIGIIVHDEEPVEMIFHPGKATQADWISKDTKKVRGQQKPPGIVWGYIKKILSTSFTNLKQI